MKSQIVFYDRKIEIPTETGFVVRNYDELIYIVYDAPYCWLYFAGSKKYKEEVTLRYMMEHLPEGTFFECNRSVILNIHHCKEYRKDKATVVMENDMAFSLARRRVKDFYKMIYHLHQVTL